MHFEEYLQHIHSAEHRSGNAYQNSLLELIEQEIEDIRSKQKAWKTSPVKGEQQTAADTGLSEEPPRAARRLIEAFSVNDPLEGGLDGLEDELMQCLSQHDTPRVPTEIRDMYPLDMATPPPKTIAVELPLPEIPERPSSEARATAPQELPPHEPIENAAAQEEDVAMLLEPEAPVAKPIAKNSCRPAKTAVRHERAAPMKINQWGEESPTALKVNTTIHNKDFEPRKTNPFDPSQMHGHLAKPRRVAVPLLNETTQTLRNAPEKLS